MIEIKVPEYYDEEYTDGMATYAILTINGIKIALNKNGLDDLKEEVERFTKPQYCYQCKKFIMNKYGEWRQGGSCCKNGPVNAEIAGFVQCVDCMNSCKDFEEK